MNNLKKLLSLSVALATFLLPLSVTQALDIDPETGTIPLNCDENIIDDFEINPSSDWDPTKEELEIEFDLQEDVDELLIQAIKDGEVIEIDEDNNANEDKYELEWEGEEDDNDDDYIEDGTWEIEVIADNYKCVETIDVEYEEPEIKEALVTKESFDLDYDEFTSLLFELDEDAIVTVEIYDGSKRVETLIDEEELEGDAWHEVFFDGTDDDGDELDDEEKYEFQITAEAIGNTSNDDTEDVSFEIEEDDSSSKNTNVYNDYLEPSIFDPKYDDSITLYYCLDEESEVTIEIFDGKNASGSEEVELLSDYEQSAGCHSLQWDGTNKNGKDLSDDVYSYKIVAQNGSSKDTEKGRFVVGDFDNGSSSGSSNSSSSSNNNVSLTNSSTGFSNSYCGGFWDTNSISDDEICSAINWAVSYGIINGNADGSLKPYDAINRAETVKMVLSVYPHITLASAYDDSEFVDLDSDEWFTPYIITAQNYGIMQGYKNNYNKYEARADQTVTRAEVLKIVYTASQSFGGYSYQFASSSNQSLPWYSPYESLAYQQNVLDTQSQLNFNGASQRQEVIVFLYRLSQAGLL
jgi:flagellar hook assembly protein FlgD